MHPRSRESGLVMDAEGERMRPSVSGPRLMELICHADKPVAVFLLPIFPSSVRRRTTGISTVSERTDTQDQRLLNNERAVTSSLLSAVAEAGNSNNLLRRRCRDGHCFNHLHTV